MRLGRADSLCEPCERGQYPSSFLIGLIEGDQEEGETVA